MKPAAQQRRDRTILFLACAACCGLAFGAHKLIDADVLDDLPTVALGAGVILAFLGAIAMCAFMAPRIGARTAPALGAALVLAAASFAAASFPDVSIALHALMTADAGGAGATVTLGPGGHDVRLSGELTDGVASRVSALLDAHPLVERIHLTSEGGLVDEGEALRKTIAAHKLVTFVPDFCVSACTLAFLGGRERFLMEDARLGFHAPFEEGLFGHLFAGDKAAERDAYLAAGASAAFVDKAMTVLPQDIWEPKADELLAAHVATGVVDRYRFPDSNLDGDASIAGARDTVVRNFPLAKALTSWRPKALDVLAGWYLDAYRRGASEGEVVDQLKSVLGAAAAVAMTSADDDTLVGLGRYVDAALGATDSVEDCIAIGEQADLIEAEAVLDQEDHAAEKLAQTLLARAFARRSNAAHIVKRPGEALATDIALDDGERACAEMRSFYQRLLHLPRADAASMMRGLATRRDSMSPLALSLVDGRS